MNKDNETIKNIILNFKPLSEKQNHDKEAFLYFINHFEDILTWNNLVGHITASAYVVNEDFSKALIIKHNILKNWLFPGGHADGNVNLLEVAIREVEEETGLKVIPYQNTPINIEVAETPAHYKRGKYVTPHLHFDVIYLLIAKNLDINNIRIKPDENSAIKWVNLEDTYNEEIVSFARTTNKEIVDKIRLIKEKVK